MTTTMRITGPARFTTLDESGRLGRVHDTGLEAATLHIEAWADPTEPVIADPELATRIYSTEQPRYRVTHLDCDERSRAFVGAAGRVAVELLETDDAGARRWVFPFVDFLRDGELFENPNFEDGRRWSWSRVTEPARG